MEDENKKLKKELADMFKALDEKEAQIQSNKNEVYIANRHAFIYSYITIR